MVRVWRGDFRKLGELILSRARLCYIGDGTLAGTTGERNQLYTASRGVIACFGAGLELRADAEVGNRYGLSAERVLALQVLASLAFGNRVILPSLLASETGSKSGNNKSGNNKSGSECSDLCALAPQGYVSLLARDWGSGSGAVAISTTSKSISGTSLEALRLCDALLFDGCSDERATYSIALADFSDRRRLLLSLDDDVCFLGVHRVVSEDTTASGGNASLLLTASQD